MKIQISIDDELLSRIDSCADRNYMSRSGFISQACVGLLNQMELVSAINRISYACQRVADAGSVDAETKRQFDEFSAIAKMFSK